MKIYACHLLNDFSGSPKVLSQLINGWAKNGQTVVVYTNQCKKGFLSNLTNVECKTFWYKWSKNKLIRLFNYTISQFILFFKLIAVVRKQDIVYVNTVLPFGAAIAAKFKGAKIIYHIHEVSITPQVLNWFLFKIASSLADKEIYVSNYVKIANSNRHKQSEEIVLYNSIDNHFFKIAEKFKKEHLSPKNVLMICSLKVYKGVFEFVELAKQNKQYNFRLVLNAQQEEIDDFFATTDLPENLFLFPSQSNTHPFYQWADLVLNLSHTDKWIETFGLTILEAMAYKLPTIAPPIGGITELVKNDENGFLIDSHKIDSVSNTLNLIFENKNLYEKLSSNAFLKARQFSEETFCKEGVHVLN